MSAPQELSDLVMPEGWFCVNVSPTGVGLYEKWFVKEKPAQFGSRVGTPYRQTTKYRVTYNGFCGGWTIQAKYSGAFDWSWFMPNVAFPSAVGAMLALEVELSNNKT